MSGSAWWGEVFAGTSLPVIVTDLGYGDAGKGTMVDWLARETNAVAVVRYNGGAQAGHNVVLEKGTHHEFAQFGAATFVRGVRTHLSRFMMVNPLNIFMEENHLRRIGIASAFERLSIDGEALVTTPIHRATNRLKELARGYGRHHGSCGQGVGETQADYLRYGNDVVMAADLANRAVLVDKLGSLRERKLEEVSALELGHVRAEVVGEEMAAFDRLQNFMNASAQLARVATITDGSYLGELLEQGTVIFEGAQGALLDQWYGFHPYTTWSTTTPLNAHLLLDELGVSDSYTLGVTRAYLTRHGAGPFVTEDPALNVSEPHNVTNDWQHGFRQGYFDVPLMEYALMACDHRVDGIALTCLDKLKEFDKWKVCTGYTYRGSLTDLHPYFDRLPNGTLVGIKPGPVETHAHTEAIGNRLKDCEPVYTEAPAAEDFAAMVERELLNHVVVESWGPTHADKRARVGVVV